MKASKGSYKKLVLLVFIFLPACYPTFGQEKMNISAGAGLPELINIGARYQLNQSQLGISIGAFEESIAVTGDFYQHMFGSSKYSERRPFYARFGLTYLRDDGERFLDQYLIMALRVGRDFNVSENFGFQLDLGGFFEILHDETKKVDYPYGRGIDLDIFIPAFGLTMFYRL